MLKKYWILWILMGLPPFGMSIIIFFSPLSIASLFSFKIINSIQFIVNLFTIAWPFHHYYLSTIITYYYYWADTAVLWIYRYDCAMIDDVVVDVDDFVAKITRYRSNCQMEYFRYNTISHNWIATKRFISFLCWIAFLEIKNVSKWNDEWQMDIFASSPIFMTSLMCHLWNFSFFFFCFFLVWFFSSAQNHKLFCWNFGSSYIFLQFLHLMFSIMTNGQCLVFIAFKHFNRFLFFGFFIHNLHDSMKKKKVYIFGASIFVVVLTLTVECSRHSIHSNTCYTRTHEDLISEIEKAAVFRVRAMSNDDALISTNNFHLSHFNCAQRFFS